MARLRVSQLTDAMAEYAAPEEVLAPDPVQLRRAVAHRAILAKFVATVFKRKRSSNRVSVHSAIRSYGKQRLRLYG